MEGVLLRHFGVRLRSGGVCTRCVQSSSSGGVSCVHSSSGCEAKSTWKLGASKFFIDFCSVLLKSRARGGVVFERVCSYCAAVFRFALEFNSQTTETHVLTSKIWVCARACASGAWTVPHHLALSDILGARSSELVHSHITHARMVGIIHHRS